MNRFASGALVLSVAVLAASCSRKLETPRPEADGIRRRDRRIERRQAVRAGGTPLPQPVVVQVNDEQGAAVTGALVEFAARQE